MPKSSTELRDSLRKIQLERRVLVQRSTRVQEMAIGCVSVVQRKCGKPNCHCAQGGGHSQTLFLFQGDDGRRRCKLVRQADADRLLRAGDRYREFRATLRKLRAINKREEQILVALMEQKAVHYE
ncbi:MAG: DUF6788 family protein [Gammaproteobacteria bacterium]